MAKVGGLLHAMLPDSTRNMHRAAAHPFMFVDTALPAMFHAVYALGALKRRLVVKLAGGAEFLDENKVFNIGDQNITAVLTLLARNAVKLEASATGGRHSRTVRLDLAMGAVTLDIPGRRPVSL